MLSKHMYVVQKPDEITEPIVAKQAFVTRQQPLLDKVAARYGRNPKTLCIKVFYGNPLKKDQPLSEALWGDPPGKDLPRKNNTLFEATQIQNILWWEGHAPRVYAIFEAEYEGKRVACQLTDFVRGAVAGSNAEVEMLMRKIDLLGKKYYFSAQSRKLGVLDVIGGKLVDVQLYAFDKGKYKEFMQKTYANNGKYGKVYYQNDEKLGLDGGPRKSEKRVEYMQLDKIDFEGKIVWDLGCAGGYFLRYALDRGAKRAVGVDTSDTLEAAFHAGNYLGYFNADYAWGDLTRGVPTFRMPDAEEPDIVFFLSMNLHVGIPQQIALAKTVIFEDNDYEGRKKDTLGKPWTDWFPNIEFVGRGIDHGDKACYILSKGS